MNSLSDNLFHGLFSIPEKEPDFNRKKTLTLIAILAGMLTIKGIRII